MNKFKTPHVKLWGTIIPLSLIIICAGLAIANWQGWISLPKFGSGGGCGNGFSQAIGDSSKCCPNGYPYYWSSDGKCHSTSGTGTPTPIVSPTATTQPNGCPNGSECCHIQPGGVAPVQEVGIWILPGCKCPPNTTWQPENYNVYNGVRYEFCKCNSCGN